MMEKKFIGFISIAAMISDIFPPTLSVTRCAYQKLTSFCRPNHCYHSQSQSQRTQLAAVPCLSAPKDNHRSPRFPALSSQWQVL